METHRQWCDQRFCPDFGKIGAGNIKIYSHVEGRYYGMGLFVNRSAFGLPVSSGHLHL